MNKMATILQTAYSHVFSWEKMLYVYSYFTEVCAQWSNWQKNQYWNVLKQEETIAWTNDDPVHQYIIFLFLFVKINA